MASAISGSDREWYRYWPYTALIIVHNHPSGDATPSDGDIAMTREVQEALEKIGITLHDHLVIGRDGHESFRARGLL